MPQLNWLLIALIFTAPLARAETVRPFDRSEVLVQKTFAEWRPNMWAQPATERDSFSQALGIESSPLKMVIPNAKGLNARLQQKLGISNLLFIDSLSEKNLSAIDQIRFLAQGQVPVKSEFGVMFEAAAFARLASTPLWNRLVNQLKQLVQLYDNIEIKADPRHKRRARQTLNLTAEMINHEILQLRLASNHQLDGKSVEDVLSGIKSSLDMTDQFIVSLASTKLIPPQSTRQRPPVNTQRIFPGELDTPLDLSEDIQDPPPPGRSLGPLQSLADGASAALKARQNLEAHLSLWYVSSFASAKFKSYDGVLDPSTQFVEWDSWRASSSRKVSDLAFRLIEVLCPPPFVDTRFAAWAVGVEKLKIIVHGIAQNFETTGDGMLLRDRYKEKLVDTDPRPASPDVEAKQPTWYYMSGEMEKYIQILREDLPHALTLLSQKNFTPPTTSSERKALVSFLGSWSFLLDEPWFDVGGTCEQMLGKRPRDRM